MRKGRRWSGWLIIESTAAKGATHGQGITLIVYKEEQVCLPLLNSSTHPPPARPPATRLPSHRSNHAVVPAIVLGVDQSNGSVVAHHKGAAGQQLCLGRVQWALQGAEREKGNMRVTDGAGSVWLLANVQASTLHMFQELDLQSTSSRHSYSKTAARARTLVRMTGSPASSNCVARRSTSSSTSVPLSAFCTASSKAPRFPGRTRSAAWKRVINGLINEGSASIEKN